MMKNATPEADLMQNENHIADKAFDNFLTIISRDGYFSMPLLTLLQDLADAEAISVLSFNQENDFNVIFSNLSLALSGKQLPDLSKEAWRWSRIRKPRFINELADLSSATDEASEDMLPALALPLMTGGRLKGLIMFWHISKEDESESDSFGELVKMAPVLALLMEQVREQQFDETKDKKEPTDLENPLKDISLKNNLQLYSSILENIPGLIYRCKNDPNWTMEYISKGCLNLTGYHPEEMIGNKAVSYGEIIVEEHRTPLWETWQKVIAEGDVFEGEYQIRTADGKIKWVWEQGSGIYNGDGELLALEGIVMDVSERKRVEEALIESKQKYKYLFQNNPHPMWIYDLESFLFLEVNNAAMKHYGYSRDEFLSMTIKDIRLKEDVPQLMTDLGRHEDDFDSAGEWRHRKKNGELIYVAISSHRLTFNERPARLVLATDVTERNKALDALNESEERYRTLFKNNHAVMLLIDKNSGDIIDVNQAAVEFYGWSYEKLTSMNIADINTLSTEEIRDKLKSVDYSTHNHYEFKHRKADHTTCDVEVFSGPIVLRGKPMVHAIVHDVTPRKKAEEMLLTLSVAVQQSPASFVITDASGLIEYVNPRFSSLTGYSLEDVRGKKPRIMNAGHLSEEEYEAMWTALRKGNEWKGEFLNRTKKGRYYWENVIISPIINDENVITQFIVIMEDVTDKKRAENELRKSEASLREAQEIARMGDWEYDLLTETLHASENCHKIFGLESKKVRNSYHEFVDRLLPDDQYLIRHIYDRLSAEKRMIEDKIRIILPSGKQRWLNNRIVPVMENGVITKLKGVVMDITDHKRMEDALVKAKEQAEEGDKLKSAFLANISHEIRTPMNAIVGFTNLLDEQIAEEEREQFIRIINSNADHLLNIIDDVMAVSRMDTEAIPLKHSRFSLPELMEDLHLSFRREVYKKPITLVKKHVNGQEPDSLIADREKIRQVMSSFLSNAIKYTEEGLIEIGYSFQDSTVRFFVKDTGMGIRKEEQRKIFERFYRTVTAQKQAISGTGLGLSIAEGLVKLMEGEIGVESLPGKGSEFYFTIPVPEKSTI